MLPWLALRPVPALAQRDGLRGCIGIAVVFCITGTAHFVVTDALASMIPPFFPLPRLIIQVTGVIEIAAGLLVLPPRTRRGAGWFLVVFLAALLPFNIYAAMKHLPLAGHEDGWRYLAVRIPVQGVMMAWCWWFAARISRV